MVVIEEYAYRCVLSNAKIQLMVSDLPHVEYAKKKEKKLTKKDYDDAVKANLEIMKRNGIKPEPAVMEGEYKQISLTDLINRNNGSK